MTYLYSSTGSTHSFSCYTDLIRRHTFLATVVSDAFEQPHNPIILFFFFLMIRRPPISTLFPSPPLSRSPCRSRCRRMACRSWPPSSCATSTSPTTACRPSRCATSPSTVPASAPTWGSTSSCAPQSSARSEEHTSELQSPCNLVCRLLLET